MPSGRYEEDEDDDRPMRRRRRDDDEEYEDDRPRKQRARREEDDSILPGTPRVYVHKLCKGQTKMPTDAVQAYLENPFDLGEDPTTYCTECEEDVPWKECYWAETRQNLYEYIDDLRAEMVINGEDPRTGLSLAWWWPIILAVAAGLVVGGGTRRAAGLGLLPGLIAAAVGGLIGVGWMIWEYKKSMATCEEWNRKLLKRYYKRHPEAKQATKKRRPAEADDE
jgi:hypothetical protein